MSLDHRRAFLTGFLDALDALAQPSTDISDPVAEEAWRAGHAYFHDFVRRERTRLEAGLVRSPNPPGQPSDFCGGSV